MSSIRATWSAWQEPVPGIIVCVGYRHHLQMRNYHNVKESQKHIVTDNVLYFLYIIYILYIYCPVFRNNYAICSLIPVTHTL